MAVNEDNEDQRKGRAIGRISSQAELNAFAGGRAKSLPSVPAPGQPGSRFNPVVVDRGERMSREEGMKAPRAKSLPLNMPPGMIQGIPPAIMNQSKEEEPTVAGAAAQGFVGGFIGGAQNRMFGAAGGEQGAPNPSWRENNREAVALNTKMMATAAEGIALLDRDIAAMTDPADAAHRVQLIASRATALQAFRSMQDSMAHDQVNEDVEAGAYTDADVTTLRGHLSRMQAGNEQMRLNQQQHGGAGPRAKSSSRTAPVRNADGKSLADLTAPAPGEDPLPGTSQPLLLDALDAVQGTPPRRAATGLAKSAARTVVMNPAHVSALASLESGHEDSLENSGSHFGR